MTYHSSNVFIAQQALALIGPELQRATSDSDLQKRLARLGYKYRDTPQGRMLATLPHGIEIAPIPALHVPA